MRPKLRIHAEEIIKLGKEQAANTDVEIGAVLTGEITDTHMHVSKLIPLGAGADPGSHSFVMDDNFKLFKISNNIIKASELVRASGSEFIGMAHTHGPKVGLRTPSSADIQAATKYPVCMLLKVDANGGGRFEFFTSTERNCEAEIVGLDGKIYSNQSTVPDSCWKQAA